MGREVGKWNSLDDRRAFVPFGKGGLPLQICRPRRNLDDFAFDHQAKLEKELVRQNYGVYDMDDTV